MVYKSIFSKKKKKENLTYVFLGFFLGAFLCTSIQWIMAPVDWTEIGLSCEW